jgi:hypothetical protein
MKNVSQQDKKIMPYCAILNGAGRVLETRLVSYKDYSFNKGGQYQAIEALLPSVAEEASNIDVYEQQPGCGSTLLSTYHLKGCKPKVFAFITHTANLTHRKPEKSEACMPAVQSCTKSEPCTGENRSMPPPIAPPKPAPTVDSDQDNPFSLFE